MVLLSAKAASASAACLEERGREADPYPRSPNCIPAGACSSTTS
jgi:hypothetical protein